MNVGRMPFYISVILKRPEILSVLMKKMVIGNIILLRLHLFCGKYFLVFFSFADGSCELSCWKKFWD